MSDVTTAPSPERTALPLLDVLARVPAAPVTTPLRFRLGRAAITTSQGGWDLAPIDPAEVERSVSHWRAREHDRSTEEEESYLALLAAAERGDRRAAAAALRDLANAQVRGGVLQSAYQAMEAAAMAGLGVEDTAFQAGLLVAYAERAVEAGRAAAAVLPARRAEQVALALGEAAPAERAALVQGDAYAALRRWSEAAESYARAGATASHRRLIAAALAGLPEPTETAAAGSGSWAASLARAFRETTLPDMEPPSGSGAASWIGYAQAALAAGQRPQAVRALSAARAGMADLASLRPWCSFAVLLAHLAETPDQRREAQALLGWLEDLARETGHAEAQGESAAALAELLTRTGRLADASAARDRAAQCAASAGLADRAASAGWLLLAS